MVTSGPNAGHTIPYHYTDSEAWDFIKQYQFAPVKGSDTVLNDYLYQRTPTYGVIVTPWALGEILVWYDATQHLHVVDVTNLSIAKEIAKTVYVAPGSSTLQNLWENTAAFVRQVQNQTLPNLAVIAAAVAIVYVVSRR